MTNRGDYRNLRSRHSPHYDFFVKGPQVFHGAPSPTYNEHIRQPVPVHEAYGMGDFPCCRLALHLHRIQQQFYSGISATGHRNHVTHCSPGLGSDNTHSTGMGRKKLFPFCLKQTFRLQFVLQRLIGLHQTADAFFDQQIRVQLVHPVTLIDANVTDGDHGITITGILDQLPGLTLKHDAFQHTGRIF